MPPRESSDIQYNFTEHSQDDVLNSLSKEELIATFEKMVLIRQFEVRASAAYQTGAVGGFFHAYTGQEAIQTAAVCAMGIKENWWTTTYRCHALALLLGESPESLMCELYGKAAGNAKGRGGSMHFFSERMLGGYGIVAGHLPIATGAGFSLKYKGEKGVSICFLGDGAVVQGTVHESLNLAALWDLPCIYVVENNQWGMGTATKRAVAKQPIAENLAKSYGMESYTLKGMDFFNCYAGFAKIYAEVLKKGKPILVEAVTERFVGHSISDPGLYRSKAELEEAKKRDPITFFGHTLIEKGILTQEEAEAIKAEKKQQVMQAMDIAEKSPAPRIETLEEDVFAP
ncbi:pyruvate dehydrogenase (acetyl-transferring) E1 component subunit alpha [Candidatus Aerophobetes bacterium]|uniref:Pyruvate dehydrogenase (Acetyl-transferring) E1 component subunit alpha n=1 Tax=Aerophobetes bacterium TaxID=2030807 RepID=A0A2A4X6A7_UNCAE|nr:MAG: pyruvate dehydrogenase (acetyl-transferring) E1 component subunit alpha [Candidatus Aerophobetes bacterium]